MGEQAQDFVLLRRVRTNRVLHRSVDGHSHSPHLIHQEHGGEDQAQSFA